MKKRKKERSKGFRLREKLGWEKECGVLGGGGGGESFSYNAPRVWFSASLCIYKTQNENHSNNQVHDIL